MSMIIAASDPSVAIRHARSTVTFDGTAGGGATGTDVTVFTCTGAVLILNMTVRCTTNIADSGGTGTIRLGSTSGSTAFRADITAVDLDAGGQWTPEGNLTTFGDNFPVGPALDGEPYLLQEDMMIRPGVEDITGGVIVVDVWYLSVTDGGNLA